MKKKRIDDKKENKRPFFYSQFYDASDIEAASKNAYEMSSKELNRRRKRDWIFLLIGVPAFIALLYLIALALR